MDHCNIFKIWEEYKSSLLGYINKRVDNQEDAKDILQEVLLKSYHYCIKGREIIYLKSWLYKITQNTIVDYYKKSNSNQELYLDIIDDKEQNSALEDASNHIKSLLKLIPEKYAMPLYMSDIDGITPKDIAVSLGLTLSNTKSRIQRARIKLKEKFLECCVIGFGANGDIISFEVKQQCVEIQMKKE